MNIYVYESENLSDFTLCGVLDSYKSFNFTKKFQGCGSWTIKGLYTPEAALLLKAERIIYVNKKINGIIVSVNFDVNDKGEMTYTASGTELKGILNRRIVWGTYSGKASTSNWARELVRQECVTPKDARRKLLTRIDGVPQSDTMIEKQVSYKNLLDTLNKVFDGDKQGKLAVGYDVVLTLGKTGKGALGFDTILGADRTINSSNPFVISRMMDTVSSLSATTTSKGIYNVALAAGEGEGTERKLATAGNLNLSGLARKEVFADCREIQSKTKDESGKETTITEADYLKLLAQEAQDALNAKDLSVEAETVVSMEQALNLLGATVTVIDKQFEVQTEDFISEVNIIDEADGSLSTLTVGRGVDAQKFIMRKE